MKFTFSASFLNICPALIVLLFSLPNKEIVFENSFFYRAVLKLHFAVAVLDVFAPLSFVLAAVSPRHCAEPMAHVPLEFPSEDVSRGPNIRALSVLLPPLKASLVPVAVDFLR